ncbi:MAG: class A beta-lactamase-related serine hydrolase [Acidaminococcaceae bacterium]|jgi:beta-lactamase class A|nr:class A beta-lactamase-related serine hydrolase [Acidaminococcaceae bacterium]
MWKQFLAVLACSIFMAGCMTVPTDAKTVAKAEVPAAAQTEKLPEEVFRDKMAAALKPVLTNGHADFNVYVQDLRKQRVYVNKSEILPSASMIKMYILAYAYQQMQQGKLTEQETITLQQSDKVGGAGNIQGLRNGTPLSIHYLLTKMVVDSDNVATNMIIDRLGMTNIQRYITEQGYRDTKLQRCMMDFTAQRQGRENFTSVQDLAKIFSKLYRHQCVNPGADAAMLEILKGQTDNDKIAVGLPAGSVFAHKTGELEGYLHDGGIIYNPKGDYLLIIMTKENYGPGTVTQDMVQLSRLVAREIYQ